MAQQVAVIGLGRFGRSVALTLADAGVEVLAIDQDLSVVEEIADRVSSAVAFDATQEGKLEAHAVGSMHAAVVGIGEHFESTVLITALLNELGVPRIISRAFDATQRRILSLVGAHEVLNPEEEMGVRTAHGLVRHDVVDFIDLPEGFEVRHHTVDAGLAEKDLGALRERAEEEIRVLLVTRRRQASEDEDDEKEEDDEQHEDAVEQMPLPTDDLELREGDVVTLVGSTRALDRL